MLKTDFLIVGGGIIGLRLAIELKSASPQAIITIIDKEKKFGQHASGRNSGVIHAGLYYKPGSLKAKLSREGNFQLTEYIIERNLSLLKCGKLIVSTNESELEGLNKLFLNGQANGVPLSLISEDEAREIEPRAKTFSKAIFSPTTSSGDPEQVILSLLEDAKNLKINILYEFEYLGVNKKFDTALTSKGDISFGFFVNCAGLYADKIAKQFHKGKNYDILPFKGIYLKSSEPANSYKCHIYPVPDPRFPFLGVHLTLSANGMAKIGPTAIPALWREQYNSFDNFNIKEFFEIALRGTSVMFKSGPEFKELVLSEMKKYYRPTLINQTQKVIYNLDQRNFTKWGRPGIRAQLVNVKTGEFEMDFILEHDQKSLHVLNAVSPGWTCSFSFSKYLSKKIFNS